jgi:hypothetical protein
MKKIKVEVLNNVEKYEAVDGTIFETESQCEIYEKSAYCILKDRFQKLIISNEKNAWELMGGFGDENIVLVKLNNLSDVDTFIQFMCLEHPYYQSNEEDRLKLRIKLEEAVETNDICIVSKNDLGYHFIKNLNQLISNLKNFAKISCDKNNIGYSLL